MTWPHIGQWRSCFTRLHGFRATLKVLYFFPVSSNPQTRKGPVAVLRLAQETRISIQHSRIRLGSHWIAIWCRDTAVVRLAGEAAHPVAIVLFERRAPQTAKGARERLSSAAVACLVRMSTYQYCHLGLASVFRRKRHLHLDNRAFILANASRTFLWDFRSIDRIIVPHAKNRQRASGL